MKNYNIVVLKGDGIGPEIVDEALKVLDATGEKYGFKFNYDYKLMGGCAIDATGEPLPQETVDAFGHTSAASSSTSPFYPHEN